jgi:hypothetical protein
MGSGGARVGLEWAGWATVAARHDAWPMSLVCRACCVLDASVSRAHLCDERCAALLLVVSGAPGCAVVQRGMRSVPERGAV